MKSSETCYSFSFPFNLDWQTNFFYRKESSTQSSLTWRPLIWRLCKFTQKGKKSIWHLEIKTKIESREKLRLLSRITARHRFFAKFDVRVTSSSCPHCHLQHSSYFSKKHLFLYTKHQTKHRTFTATSDNEMENEELVIICRVCQTEVELGHFDIHQKCDTCHRWGWQMFQRKHIWGEKFNLKKVGPAVMITKAACFLGREKRNW